MKELILIAIGAALVNNVVLSQFLGICAFLGVSKKMDTAAGMGGAVIFVLTISSFVTSLIYKFILAPAELDYLKTIVFILVIAALVQLVESPSRLVKDPRSSSLFGGWLIDAAGVGAMLICASLAAFIGWLIVCLGSKEAKTA